MAKLSQAKLSLKDDFQDFQDNIKIFGLKNRKKLHLIRNEMESVKDKCKSNNQSLDLSSFSTFLLSQQCFFWLCKYTNVCANTLTRTSPIFLYMLLFINSHYSRRLFRKMTCFWEKPSWQHNIVIQKRLAQKMVVFKKVVIEPETNLFLSFKQKIDIFCLKENIL